MFLKTGRWTARDYILCRGQCWRVNAANNDTYPANSSRRRTERGVCRIFSKLNVTLSLLSLGEKKEKDTCIFWTLFYRKRIFVEECRISNFKEISSLKLKRVEIFENLQNKFLVRKFSDFEKCKKYSADGKIGEIVSNFYSSIFQNLVSDRKSRVVCFQYFGEGDTLELDSTWYPVKFRGLLKKRHSGEGYWHIQIFKFRFCTSFQGFLKWFFLFCLLNHNHKNNVFFSEIYAVFIFEKSYLQWLTVSLSTK